MRGLAVRRRSPNYQYMALYLSQMEGTVTFLEEGLDDLLAALLCCVEEGRAFDVVLRVEVNIIPA
jgi:hypothetical protein